MCGGGGGKIYNNTNMEACPTYPIAHQTLQISCLKIQCSNFLTVGIHFVFRFAIQYNCVMEIQMQVANTFKTELTKC